MMFAPTDPVQWTDVQVIQWLTWAIREFSLEGVVISNFARSGQELCALGREEFLSRAPPFMGDILWEHLEILQRGEYWGFPLSVMSFLLEYIEIQS